MEDREGETESLSGTCWRASDEVRAGEDGWNGQGLDGRRDGDVEVGEGTEKRRR